MKELGTPPLTKTYFKKIFEYLPRFARIILVISKNHVCSSILTIKVSENELFAPFISTPRKYQKDESSYLVYLEAVKEAKNLGCSVMNFGRSIDGSGPALFKQRYGLKVVPLYMYSPHKNWSVTNPEKSFLRYAVAIWKKLPIPITRVAGVILGKHLI